jgi:hypothetical protein
VLVVAQPVAAGQVLTPGDVRVARVSTGSGLDVVLSGQEALRAAGLRGSNATPTSPPSSPSTPPTGWAMP